MQLNETMRRMRSLLLELLLFLSAGESCWYTINVGPEEYSLARRLGFVRKDEYYAFLVGTGLASYISAANPDTNKHYGKQNIKINKDQWSNLISNNEKELEVQPFQVDWKNAMKGRKQEKKEKDNLHVIRIGKTREETEICDDEDQIGWSHRTFGWQLRDRSMGEHKPPPLLQPLAPKQRKFKYGIRDMVTDILSQSTNDDDDSTDDDDDDIMDDDDDNDDDDEDVDDTTKDCEEPAAKKSKPTTVKHSLECREDGTVDEDEAAKFISELDPKVLNTLFAAMVKKKHEESQDSHTFSYRNVKNYAEMQYVRVPKNKLDETDESFTKYSDWLERAIDKNCGADDKSSKFKSRKRLAKYVMKRHRDAAEEAMEEMDMLPQQQMNAVKMVAMFKAANITSKTKRRALLRHLRHHFGKHSFATERTVQSLSEGYTKVEAKHIMYEKVPGEMKIRIDYQQRNIADEVAAKLTRELNSRRIVDPTRVYSVDVMAGGDHGKGAFIFGAKVVVIISKEDDPDKIDWGASFDFEINCAEIICGKDSADLISLTIKDELTKGLKTLATRPLHLRVIIDDETQTQTIKCTYEDSTAGTNATHTIEAIVFIVGDLAFYGMCLGKESMSGKWCHICKTAAADMGTNLCEVDELWKGIEEIKQYAAKYKSKVEAWEKSTKANKSATPPKPELGVKDEPWWDFIPLDHYIVPLLHCNIGIGDIILSSFRDFVSEHIEYITEEEAAARSVKTRMQEKLKQCREERDAWKQSVEGKKLESLKGRRRRAKKMLKDAGAVDQTCTVLRKAVINFVEEANQFLTTDEDNIKEEGAVASIEATSVEVEVNPSASASAHSAAGSAEQDELTKKIEETKAHIVAYDEEIKSLEKKYKCYTARVDSAAKFITGINKEVEEFKSVRKNRGDGLESEMMKVLLLYNITIQAYHGGSLHGKDVQKFMSNA